MSWRPHERWRNGALVARSAGKRKSPARNVAGVRSGPARWTPVKKRSGACTSRRNVFAIGPRPDCHTRIVASSSTSSAWRVGSSVTPIACRHCRWSYWRPKTRGVGEGVAHHDPFREVALRRRLTGQEHGEHGVAGEDHARDAGLAERGDRRACALLRRLEVELVRHLRRELDTLGVEEVREALEAAIERAGLVVVAHDAEAALSGDATRRHPRTAPAGPTAPCRRTRPSARRPGPVTRASARCTALVTR